MTTQQIRKAALALDPVERESLAEELLLSVCEADRPTIDAAWLAEARSRDASLNAGTSRPKPVEEIISRLSNKVSR